MNYPATLIILAACIIISLICFRDRDRYFIDFAEWPYSIVYQKKFYQVITSAFLHSDYFHLIFNMFTLFSFGSFLEEFFIMKIGMPLGSFYFIIIYFSSMLLGSFFTTIIHFRNPNYVAVGASGAISGVLFSFILFFPKAPIIFFFLPIPIPAFIFAIIYILISIYGVNRKLGNIGHEAHLGGALGGVISTILLMPDSIHIFLRNF